MLNKLMSGFIGVFLRNGVVKQQLQNVVVVKVFKSLVDKTVFEPVSMSLMHKRYLLSKDFKYIVNYIHSKTKYLNIKITLYLKLMNISTKYLLKIASLYYNFNYL